MHDTPFNSARSWKINAVGALACCALAWGLYVTEINPRVNADVVRQSVQRSLDRKQLDLSARTAEAIARRAELVRLEEFTEQNETIRPQAKSINHQIALLNDLAIQYGLTIDDIVMGDVSNVEHYRCHQITLKGRGTYSDATQFVSHMHKHFLFSEVQGFALMSDPDISLHAASTFEIDLAWYAAR